MVTPLQTWSVSVPNLPDHADNPVHTDEGARAAGFPAAIVAGTSVYAVMTRVPAAAWGADWVSRGGCEVRFKAPVLADEHIDIVPTESDDGWDLEAGTPGRARATASVWLDAEVPEIGEGEPLDTLAGSLATWADYGQRCGDDLPLYADRGWAHPSAWPCVANRLFADQLVDDGWVHVRSRITHLRAAPRDGEFATRAIVVDRFASRAGTRALVHCLIEVDGQAACFVEHEAIVSLA